MDDVSGTHVTLETGSLWESSPMPDDVKTMSSSRLKSQTITTPLEEKKNYTWIHMDKTEQMSLW